MPPNPQVLSSLPNAPRDGYSWASLATIEYLSNPSNGQLWQFLYNPSALSFERSANYEVIDLPYTNAQPVQWKNTGGTQLTISDLLLDGWGEGKSIRPTLASLQKLMVGSADTDPPKLIFTWGSRTINPLVLVRLRWEENAWAPNGDPMRAKVALTVIQTG